MKTIFACLAALGLACAFAWPEAPEPASPGKERADKLRTDLGGFMIALRFFGDEAKPHRSLILSAHGIRRAATSMFESIVIIDKAEAKEIIGWLEKSGVLGGAQDMTRGVDAYEGPDGPCYLVTISGAKMTFEASLGWGKDLEPKLLGLRAVLESASMRQLDVLLGSIGIKPPDVATDRIAKTKEGVKEFDLSLNHSGIEEKPYPRFFLTTVKGDDELAGLVIDEAQALAVIKRLEADGFFTYARAKVAADGERDCFILHLKSGGLVLEENLGSGAPLVERLRSLKSALEGPAADALGRVITRVGG